MVLFLLRTLECMSILFNHQTDLWQLRINRQIVWGKAGPVRLFFMENRTLLEQMLPVLPDVSAQYVHTYAISMQVTTLT